MKRNPMAAGPPEWQAVADELAEHLDADVIFLSGAIQAPCDVEVMTAASKKSRKNVVLMLTTFGGSGEAAYRIAHCLQTRYSDGEFILFVPMMCKSAGTLIAVGAHQIIMADTAELGPLDVQISKADEVGERHSGLTPSQTLNMLKTEAFGLFEHLFNKMRYERMRFPTRLAASIAGEMTVGMLRPLYEQIDPIRLGEIERAMMVAAEYGERIKTDNLKDGSLDKLITAYPSHGFVIDRDEAATLFFDVRAPSAEEYGLFVKTFPLIDEAQKAAVAGESARVLLLSTVRQPTLPQSAGVDHDDEPTNGQPAADSAPEGHTPFRETSAAQAGESHQEDQSNCEARS